MEKFRTDSLGIEILNQIFVDEKINKITLFDSEEKAILSHKTKEVLVLFEVFENDKVKNYFILPKKLYTKITDDYKLEGVEI